MTRWMDCCAMDTRALLDFMAPPRFEPENITDTEVMTTAWQAAALPKEIRAKLGDNTITVIPDFLNYARMINTGQAGAMLGLSGSKHDGFMCALKALPSVLAHPLRAMRKDFWLVAAALLRYDIALLPADYRGVWMLHSYLADFSFFFDRGDVIKALFDIAGVGGAAGVHTQHLPLAMTCLARWGIAPKTCAFLYSPSDVNTLEALRSARRVPCFKETRFIADISNMPGDLQASSQDLLAPAASQIDGIIVSASDERKD